MQHLKGDFDFHAAIPVDSKVKSQLEAENFKVVEIPFIDRSKKDILKYFPMLFVNARRLKSYCFENEIDLLHLNNFYNLVPFSMCLLGFRKPMVVHVRTLASSFRPIIYNTWVNANLWAGEKVLAVSNAVKVGLPKNDKVELLYDSIPFDEKHPLELNGKESGHTKLLYPANYFPGKGQQYAIQAMPRVLKERPNVQLKFVGSHFDHPKAVAFKNELIAYRSENKLEANTEISDFCSDIEKEMKSSDIILNFADKESFSIVNAEALYFGRALISADSGGPRELLENGKSGILVEPGNVEKMAQAIIDLVDDKEKRKSLGKEARAYVRKKFDPSLRAGQLKEIYNSLIVE